MERRPIGLAVKGLIYSPGGRWLFLLRSRASRWYPNKWELPGGKMDAGEAVGAALVREVREETGLEIVCGELLGLHKVLLPKVQVALLFIEARSRSSRVRLSDEHEESVWVSPEEVLELDLSEQVEPFLADFVQRRGIQGRRKKMARSARIGRRSS